MLRDMICISEMAACTMNFVRNKMPNGIFFVARTIQKICQRFYNMLIVCSKLSKLDFVSGNIETLGNTKLTISFGSRH
jgi:hypothetical protein